MSQLSQSKFSQRSYGPSRSAVRAYMGNIAAKKIQRFFRARSRKSSGDIKVVGGAKRGNRGNNQAVRLSRSLDSHVVFPDQIETTLTTTMDFYWPAGRMTAAAGNYFDVWVNNIIAPFNNSYPATLAPGVAYASNAVLVQGYSIANNPIGLTALQGIYTNYRVFQYKLEITVTPTTNTDSCRLVCIPLGSEEIPSAAAANVDLRVMEAQPYSLSKTCGSGMIAGPGVNNTLVISGAPYKDLGITREVYAGSGYQTPVTTSPALTIASFVGVFLQQLNGANNTQAVLCQCKLTQVVRFEELDAPIS